MVDGDIRRIVASLRHSLVVLETTIAQSLHPLSVVAL
jgi:hypothetical protein